jgi:DNA repair protein RecO (recombination protein O)
MSTPRGHRVDSIVVRTVDFAETSQVVHLVTAQGLVAALAKGARSPKGAFQGGLTLGVLGEADLLPRRGAELELLRAFRVTDGLRGLHDDLERFDAGGRILALVRDLARPGLANETLFLAAVTTLKALATSPPALAPTWVAVFEARALASTGHRPHLASCVLCGQPLARDVVFAAAAGGAAHRRCGPTGPLRPLSAADLAALDRLYTARIPALASNPLSRAELRAVHAVHALFLPYAFEGSGAVARAARR